MRTVPKILALTSMLCVPASAFPHPIQIQGQLQPSDSAVTLPSYSVFAGLAIDAPVIVSATIRSISRLKPAEAPDLAPTMARLYVEADVVSLIRAPSALPPKIGYLLDVPYGPGGRLPKLAKMRVLLFARPTTQAGQIQLIHSDAQRLWSPDAEALTRRIVAELVANDAPPAISGVGNAFHVPGTLPGEGQTQIFLTTADSRPVSLTVNRTGDGQRTWSVALREIVGAGLPPPPRDTLLWYRLACALPATLPDSSVSANDPDNAGIARDDYAFVIRALGPCDRGGTL